MNQCSLAVEGLEHWKEHLNVHIHTDPYPIDTIPTSPSQALGGDATEHVSLYLR